MKLRLAIIALCLAFTANASHRNIKLALEFYSSQRAWKVGDLITIDISESTAAKKNEKISTDKSASAHTGSSSTSIGDNEYHHNEGKYGAMNRIGETISDIFEGLPNYNLNASSKYDGSGSASSNESFRSTFTARVTDVLPNGVLVIRGERMVILKNERVNMVLSGLVRTRDIDETNTVASSRLADAHIVYENGGDVSRGTQPGFFWKIIQFFNPF